MSYLGWPRLHFAGRFQADVATVNNVLAYYDNNLFEPRFQRPQVRPLDMNGLWNPRGTGSFRLRDCRITSVLLPDGSSPADPLVGGLVAEDNRRVNAKMVDLDPQQQLATAIYGLTLRLVTPAGVELCRGAFAPAALEDFWVRWAVQGQQPDPASAYQSVLTDLQWADHLDSPFARALREAAGDGPLSVKFNVDGTDIDPDRPDTVTFGRITGTVGVHHEGEARHFLAARRLRRVPGSPFNQAPCEVGADGRVFLDLGNSIPTTGRGGPLVPVGPLWLAVPGPDGRPRPLAELSGLDGDHYRLRASVLTAQLTPAQLAEAADAPLALVGAEGTALLAEHPSGEFARADGPVLRLSPEESTTATVHVTRFGRPAPGVRLYLGPANPVLDHPAEVVTDERGRAAVPFTGHDPGNPRGPLDGQLVQPNYGFADRPGVPEGRFSVRVYDAHPVPERPTWVADVQPILQQYANLFPVMRDILDLGNHQHVLTHRSSVRASLLQPLDSPNHMPATRDLSPAKRDVVVRWLDSGPRPPVLEIPDVAALREVLQQALLVEQAVIPPYLTALFSLKPDRNTEIAEIIRGVVREEMLHLALVANLLNAVGGTPRIGRPGLVPTYPNRLPGSVLPELVVRLRACSIEHVREVFMAIEAPEHPVVDGERFTGAVINTDELALARDGSLVTDATAHGEALASWFTRAEYDPLTIGWFYNQIARAICRLDAEGELFTGDPARQLVWPDAPGTLYRVTDRTTALLAIYEIIEQGEGSPGEAGEFGHYYRFQEIVEGRRLIQDPGGNWVFEGEEVPFDPDGVFPMADDPDSYRLPAGSLVRRESLLCDEFHTNMLTALDRVVNGHPEELFDAVALMFAVEVQAKKLLAMPHPGEPGRVAGPAFQSPGIRTG
ncbi:hypothetical protein JOF53_000755 [Crossiella equi]|uniref:Iminophenyl-pyruvate dimer synthase domain-containing protein n=2 Tax=Crossiella equi TaxID=130796 RepID=A0ABS5A5K3_9PSEU|nr:ferritin-like protein [Crossiella equi]MBP2471883.1 hypothetical protein [Crossiella equi]